MTTVGSIRAISKLLPAEASHTYGVWCYLLNRDILTEGKADLYGAVVHLGSFASKTKAEKHAKMIMTITGCTGIEVSKYGYPVLLKDSTDSANTVLVQDNVNTAANLEAAQAARETARLKELEKKRKAIDKELLAETDSTSIEYYKRQCYIAMQAKVKYDYYTKLATEALEAYNKAITAASSHLVTNPTHDTELLPMLEEKLQARGEQSLYNSMVEGYKVIRPEILKRIN